MTTFKQFLVGLIGASLLFAAFAIYVIIVVGIWQVVLPTVPFTAFFLWTILGLCVSFGVGYFLISLGKEILYYLEKRKNKE